MNKIKRVLSFVLVIAMLAGMFVIPVGAVDGASAELRLEKTASGYQVAVWVKIPQKIRTFSVLLSYDPNVVTMEEPNGDPEQNGFEPTGMVSGITSLSSYSVVYVDGYRRSGPIDVPAEGIKLATFPFTPKGSIDSVSRTTFKLEADTSGDNATAMKKDGLEGSLYIGTDSNSVEYTIGHLGRENSFECETTANEADFPGFAEPPRLDDVILDQSRVTVNGTKEGSHDVKATAVDQRDNPFANVTWSMTDPSGNSVTLLEALDATVSIDQSGNIKVGNNAVGGDYTVTATSKEDGTKKPATLTVIRAPSSTATLQLSIADPVITRGHSAQLTLTGKDQFEKPLEPSGVTYTVDPANTGVTVSSSGVVQAALTATLGEYRIWATANGVRSNELTIRVQDKPTMTITGHSVADKPYDGEPAVLTGTATATTSDGTVVDLSTATQTVVYKEKSTGKQLGNTAPKDAGTYTVEVTYETPDYIGTQSIDFTIRPMNLIIYGLKATDRTYDGTRKVDLTYGVSGKVGSDDVDVLLEGTIASKNAGDNIPVTVNVSATGTAQANYTFDRTVLTGLTVNISKAPLSINKVTVAEKTYNGTADAVIESITFNGVVPGEVSQPTYTVANAAFDSPDTDATEVTGTVTLTGDFAANYALADGDFTVAATITPADYSVQMPYETLTVKTGTTGVNDLVGQGVKAIPNVANETISSGDVTFALDMTDAEISALAAGTYDLTWTCEVSDPNYTSRRKSGTFTLVVTANDAVNIEIDDKPDEAVTYDDRDFHLIARAFEVKTDGTTETIDNAEFTWTAEPRGIVEIDNDGNVTVVGAGTVTITVTTASAASQTYTLEVLKKPITVTMKDISASIDEDIDAKLDFDVDPADLASGDTKADLKITYDIDTKDLSAGTYPIGGSSRSENYDVTIIPGVLTVTPGTMADATVTGRTQSNPAEADPSVTIDLSAILNKIKGNFTVGTPDITVRNGMATTAEFDMTKKALTVKYNPQPANTTSTIVIPVFPVNYNNFTITVTLTAVDKEFVEVHFDDLTVEYNGRAHKLAEAYVEIDGNRVTQGITYDPHGATASDLPEYTAVGTYAVTATYESDTHFGTKTATLRITDSLLPSAKGTTPTEDVRDEDRNAGAYTVNVNPSAAGEYVIAIRGTRALDSYEGHGLAGERHEWVGLLLGLQKSGAEQSSFYFGETPGTMTRVSDFTEGLPFGSNGKEMILWLPVDQCPKDYYIGDGTKTVKLTFTFSEYTPIVNIGGGGSGATHETKIFGTGSSGSSTATKPNDDNTTVSRGTVVTSIEPNVSADNGTVSVKIDASTVTNRLDENEKVADYEDKKDTAIQVKTSGSKSAVTSTAITMDTASINAISRARAALWLTTDSGEVKIGYNGLSELYDQASGDTIVFTIGTAANGLLEVSAVSGGVQLTDLAGSAADVTVDYKNGTYYVYLVGEGALDASGNVVDPTKLTLVATGVRATGGELNFTTRLLGQFLITQTQYDSVPKAATTTFSDVPSSHWAIDAINDLASRGIVAGMGNGTFAPDAQVTREQFVRMLAGVSNEQQPTTTASRFTDVSSTAWSLAYIEWAADRGITYGKTATTFEPTSPISRQEMASMIYRYIQNSGKELPKTNSALAFNDQSEIGSWAADSVAVMQQAGIINGVAVNGGFEFRPTNAATRAECAAMLSALIKLL